MTLLLRASLLLSLCLAGCAGSGPYRAPAPAAPPQWQPVAAAAGVLAPARDDARLAAWWTHFDDPVLAALVHDALARNPDLRSAQAALAEARARRRAAGAALGPAVSAGASYARSQSGSANRRDLYSAGLDASWEPDLSGRLRSGRAAADADVATSEERLRDTRVNLAAEVALAYLDLRTAERRLGLAESTLAAREESLALAEWRRQAGLVADLDVAQARTEREASRAALPPLRTAVVQSRHRLSVLLGEAPGALGDRLAATGTVPFAATAIGIGIPADTLRQRPDVRAAGQRLAAELARLDEAKAARWPSLRLSGSIGYEALTAAGLGDSGSLARSLLASLALPLFDSGRLRAAVSVQDARLEQARLAYEAAVLAALEEVENALVALANGEERRQRLADAVASAQVTHDLARLRYQAGLSDFLTVLDSQRTLLSLQDQLAGASGALGQAQVRLYLALGGGWQEAARVPSASPAAAAAAKESE